MPTYTTKEDMAFAECCPFTIYRDGVPILAIVGDGDPIKPATETDRILAEEVRRALAAHADMLAALRLVIDDFGDDYGGPTMDAVRAAITKAEGRTDG